MFRWSVKKQKTKQMRERNGKIISNLGLQTLKTSATAFRKVARFVVSCFWEKGLPRGSEKCTAVCPSVYSTQIQIFKHICICNSVISELTLPVPTDPENKMSER